MGYQSLNRMSIKKAQMIENDRLASNRAVAEAYAVGYPPVRSPPHHMVTHEDDENDSVSNAGLVKTTVTIETVPEPTNANKKSEITTPVTITSNENSATEEEERSGSSAANLSTEAIVAEINNGNMTNAANLVNLDVIMMVQLLKIIL